MFIAYADGAAFVVALSGYCAQDSDEEGDDAQEQDYVEEIVSQA